MKSKSMSHFLADPTTIVFSYEWEGSATVLATPTL